MSVLYLSYLFYRSSFFLVIYYYNRVTAKLSALKSEIASLRRDLVVQNRREKQVTEELSQCSHTLKDLRGTLRDIEGQVKTAEERRIWDGEAQDRTFEREKNELDATITRLREEEDNNQIQRDREIEEKTAEYTVIEVVVLSILQLEIRQYELYCMCQPYLNSFNQLSTLATFLCPYHILIIPLQYDNAGTNKTHSGED